MAVFKLKLTTLTPLHIGEGRELRKDFDFAVQNGFLYRLNEDAVLQAKISKLVPDRRGMYPLPGALLTAADYENMNLFRYILPGAPRSANTDARVQSCIKDVFDRPYIPGSSLKGALRTALAWAGWGEVRSAALDRADFGRNSFWAAQPLERQIFGPNPNQDLMRALQVGDCVSPNTAGEMLIIANAQVLTLRTVGSPIELEAIGPNREFFGTLKVDDSLFSNEAEKTLHFGQRRRWLEKLVPRVQQHSLARIQKLEEWYGQVEGAERITNFYHKLASVTLAANQALIQVGWGTGWDGKTFWTHLQKNSDLFDQLVRDFRMNRAGRGYRISGDPFPKSRRVVMAAKKDTNGQMVVKPAAPFGWCLLELDAKGGE